MTLLKNISLQQLLKGAATTFLAYPLVLLSAFVGVMALDFRMDVPYEEDRLLAACLEKLAMVSGLGLILFFTLELLVRRYRLRILQRVLLWGAGLAFLALYYWLLPAEVGDRQQLRFILLFLALHLIASYIMFWDRREENAFWQFNRALFLRILIALLYTAVLYVGLSLAILAVDNLFALEIGSDLYLRLWLFLVGVFNTWFFLAGVPTKLQELEQNQQYPKGLKVFTQFVLLPLVTLYLLILYLYFGKIVVEWEWPQGWVSVLVLCFSVVGILSLLLIYPIRFASGNAWMLTFSRWFYRALFPLIILLLLAIWRRISEYGITVERYLVLVLALWLCCTAVYFLLSRRKHIKFIPITLSLVALWTAWGPFNAFQAAAWSQLSRLQDILERNEILIGSRIVPARQDISEEEVHQVSSILHYLDYMHDLEKVKSWFTEDVDSALAQQQANLRVLRIYDSNNTAVLMNLMGLDYLQPDYYRGGESTLYFHGVSQRENDVWEVRGYDYLINFHLGAGRRENDEIIEVPQRYGVESDTLQVNYKPEAEILQFSFAGEVLQLDLPPFYSSLLKQGSNQMAQEKMVLQLQGKQFSLKLELQQVALTRRAKRYRLENMSGKIFLQMAE